MMIITTGCDLMGVILKEFLYRMQVLSEIIMNTEVGPFSVRSIYAATETRSERE